MRKKSAIRKKKKVTEDHHEVPMKKTKNTPTIPRDTLELFVGHVKDLYKIDAIYIWKTQFRINVWVEEYVDNYVYPKYSIKHSYYVSYDSLEDEITDQTPKPKSVSPKA